jgi:hypothetical protein
MRSFLLSIALATGLAAGVAAQSVGADYFQLSPGGAAHFVLYCAAPDSAVARSLRPMFERSATDVETFFRHSYRQPFTIALRPDRAELDRVLQNSFRDTSFRSACWMVGTGVGSGLDLLSPRVWAEQACEHRADDTLGLRRLVLHELIHVYHGQYNPTSDFSGLDSLGWWIEGLAAYAAGQVGEKRRKAVRALIEKPGGVPERLGQFWSGPQRYGLAGSVAAYIDATYGRETTVELLAYTTAEQIFKRLKTDEAALITAWKAWCLEQY